MKLFAQFSKVEPQADGTLIAYGVASAPVRDAHGEIVTKEAMENAIKGYMEFPAVREMHMNKAAGTGLDIKIDDEGRTVFVAKIVAKDAVDMVKHRVYRGFSIGGKIKKRNPQDYSIIQEIDLQEISLVDRPSCPAATLDLWKRDDTLGKAGDMGASDTSEWTDKDRWDDGFDFFGHGSDSGRREGPSSVADGGPYRADTPGSDTGAGPFTSSGEWRGAEFDEGGDRGKGQMPSDPNANLTHAPARPNATVNTAGNPSSAGGGQTSSADYFSAGPGHNLQRLFDMVSDLYYAEVNRDDLFGKRTFTAEQRKDLAAKGAAMKDGSYPIENKGDLRNAIQAIGRAKNPEATKAHIKRRAAALGASNMLPDTWKSAESEGGLNNKQRSPANIEHIDKGAPAAAAASDKGSDLIKDALAALERLELKHRRTTASPEAFRLAKAYKAMPEEELAEVLSGDALSKAAGADDRLAKAESALASVRAENEMLVKKLADTSQGLELLTARVAKLADMPLPVKTAGNVHAIAKHEDTNEAARTSPEEARAAKEAFAKLSQEDQSLLLTKAALMRPRTMNLSPIPSPPRSEGGGTAGRV